MSAKQLEHHQVWKNPLHFIAFGFGSGLLPVMPGTYATIVAIPIFLILQSFGWAVYAIATVAITIFGAWLSDKVERDIGIHDHPGMNFDEIVGYLVTMFLAPQGWFWILLGFGLFRFFDIVKPWPIGWVDKNIGGGIGVVLDDVIAGLCSFAVIQVIAYFL